MRIYLFRHGETDSNIQGIIQGTLDTQLNENGHDQADLLGQRLKDVQPSHIFCSDLQRCRETLRHVLDRTQDTLPNGDQVVYTEALRERYMAELQGVSKETVQAMCLQENKSKFDFGESTDALTQRVQQFWTEHISPLMDADADDDTSVGAIFICSHGGTLLSLVHCLNTTFNFTLLPGTNFKRASPNTGLTLLETRTMSFELYADISHLDALGAAQKSKDEKMEVVDA